MTYPVYRLSPLTIDVVAAAGLAPREVEDLVARALSEDIGGDGVDVTTVATVPADQRGVLCFVARAEGVVSGIPLVHAVFDVISDGTVRVTDRVADGARIHAGQEILRAEGLVHHLLRGERPALNLMCHSSGISTVTARWVEQVKASHAAIRDTRKTTPGMRSVEKYAVRAGGGLNHRMHLADAALVKDNHVIAAGGVAQAFAAVRAKFPDLDVEIEVDTLDQLREALDAGADLVLLDNFSVDEMREAVAINAGRARLEASGGLSLETAASVAATGVDYLAVGALTHSAPILDIGADLQMEA